MSPWSKAVVVIALIGIGIALFFYTQTSSSEEIEADIFAVFEICDEAEARTSCYDREVESMSRAYGTERMLAVLEALQSDARVKDCHIFTHAVGHVVYKEAESFTTSFSGCTDYCFSGCFHGVAEEHFSQLLSEGQQITSQTFSELNELHASCNKPNKGDECWKVFGDALHGVGHALMFLLGNDVPESLMQCDTVTPGNNAIACYDGVFMSNNEAFFELEKDTEFAILDDPLFPCPQLSGVYQDTCYKSAAEYRLTGSAKEKFETCEQFPTQNQEYCFEQVARSETVNTNDHDELTAICTAFTEEYQEHCVRGTKRHVEDKFNVERAQEFCTALPENLQVFCEP